MHFTLLALLCLFEPICPLNFTPYEICLRDVHDAKSISEKLSLGNGNTSQCIISAYQTVPRSCLVGTGHQMIGDAQSSSKHKACLARPLWHRDSVDMFLKDGEVVFHRFMETVWAENIDAVSFFGDSVTVQLAHFISCDLLRSGNYYLTKCEDESKNIFMNERYGGCDNITSRNGSKSLVLRSRRMDVACIYSKCNNISFDVHESLKQLLVAESEISRTLVIYNWGLHIHPKRIDNNPDDYYEEVMNSISKSMLHYGAKLKARHNSILGFRETSSQHFNDAPDGQYELRSKNQLINGVTPLCCPQHTPNNESIDFRDAYLLRYLRENDDNRANWSTSFPSFYSSSVLWIRFYQESLRLFDLHVEISRRQAVDCTHYIYAPGMSAVLLRSITMALNSNGID